MWEYIYHVHCFDIKSAYGCMWNDYTAMFSQEHFHMREEDYEIRLFVKFNYMVLIFVSYQYANQSTRYTENTRIYSVESSCYKSKIW